MLDEKRVDWAVVSPATSRSPSDRRQPAFAAGSLVHTPPAPKAQKHGHRQDYRRRRCEGLPERAVWAAPS